MSSWPEKRSSPAASNTAVRTSIRSPCAPSTQPPSIPAAAFRTLPSRSPSPFLTTSSLCAIVKILASGKFAADREP